MSSWNIEVRMPGEQMDIPDTDTYYRIFARPESDRVLIKAAEHRDHNQLIAALKWYGSTCSFNAVRTVAEKFIARSSQDEVDQFCKHLQRHKCGNMASLHVMILLLEWLVPRKQDEVAEAERAAAEARKLELRASRKVAEAEQGWQENTFEIKNSKETLEDLDLVTFLERVFRESGCSEEEISINIADIRLRLPVD